MSAYTTAECYRAGGNPPTVTTEQLADFAEAVFALGIIEDTATMILHLKYGQAVNQDDKGTNEWEEVAPGISRPVDYPWDFSGNRLSRAEALRVLRDGPPQRSGPTIYRADIDFGLMREEVVWLISRDREATDGPIFDSLAFSIEPVILSDPQEDEQFQVGWLSFAVHGPGYLFPYTYEESVARLRAQPALVEVREICRSMWPASTSPVPDAVLDGRRQMGKLWADPVDAPWDWYWAINETY